MEILLKLTQKETRKAESQGGANRIPEIVLQTPKSDKTKFETKSEEELIKP